MCFHSKSDLPSKRPLDSQWVCKPQQEPLPDGGFAGPALQEGSRDGEGSNISSLLQQTIHSTQTKSEMAAHLGPQCSKPIFERKNIQNGNPRNNSDLLTTRGMGNIAGFPHSDSHQVPKVPQVSLPEPIIPVLGPSFWPLNSSESSLVWSKRSS